MNDLELLSLLAAVVQLNSAFYNVTAAYILKRGSYYSSSLQPGMPSVREYPCEMRVTISNAELKHLFGPKLFFWGFFFHSLLRSPSLELCSK